MNIFDNSCPRCGYRFRWIERVHSARCFGFVRKVVTCPGCSARVIWSKQPWRRMMAGGFISVGLLPVGIAMGWDHSFEAAAIYWAAVVIVALLYMCVACYRLRFELAGGGEPATAPNPAVASPLDSGHHRRGVGEPGSWTI